MKHYWYLLLFFIFAFLFVPLFRNSPNASVVLNEIYPAPQTGEFEWVELYNTGNEFVDISQYQILDADGHKIKIATTSAPPYSFIISTSSAVLNNSGDTVLVKNNFGEILEIATYSGSFDSSKVFAKCPDGSNNWFSSNFITKNGSNETACFSLTPTPVLTPTIVQIEVPTTTFLPTNSPTVMPPVDYDSVFISEIYPYPNKDEQEWVELYNSNENEVVLTDWKIDDIENGGSSPHSFSLTIPAKQYSVVSFSSSLFNNDGDNVRLLNSSGVEKDSVEYENAKQGFSFGRQSIDTDTYCLQNPSQNGPSNSCNEKQPTEKPTQTQTNTTMPIVSKKGVPTPRSTSKSKKTTNTNLFIHEGSPAILGESTQLADEYISFFPYLSLIATSYALLTLASVFAKMRYADSS